MMKNVKITLENEKGQIELSVPQEVVNKYGSPYFLSKMELWLGDKQHNELPSIPSPTAPYVPPYDHTGIWFERPTCTSEIL